MDDLIKITHQYMLNNSKEDQVLLLGFQRSVGI
jgi:hypothetical protein